MPESLPHDRLRLRNQLDELDRLHTFVSNYGEQQQIAAEDSFAITLALDELVTNVIVHGYDDTAEHEILIGLCTDGDSVVVEVEDDARPFDPSQSVAVNLSANLEERAIGGLGLHLVHRTMDQLTYRRADGKNHLQLRKRLSPRLT